MGSRRLLSLLVLVSGLLVGVLAGTAQAHPPAGEGSPVELQATRVGQASAPFDVRVSGDVVRFRLSETAVTTGTGISLQETARYRCTQTAEAIRCRGAVQATGEVLGQSGTARARLSLTCDLALTCEGRAVIHGVSGELADLWGTATATSSPGRAEISYRLYGI
ncbi:hypothetical protein [Geodermatophilus sp. SYSU D01036]